MIFIILAGIVLLVGGILIVEWRHAKQAGHSGLVAAAGRGDKDGVMKSLAKGVDPNVRDAKGVSVLGAAAAAGADEMVSLLIEKGASVDAEDGAGRTALHYAAESGILSSGQLLLSKGSPRDAASSKDQRTPAMLAAMKGHSEVLEAILDGSALDLNREDADGRTALMHAAAGGHAGCVRLLFQAGANVNYGKTSTPLLEAVKGGHIDAADVLLEAGAAVEGRGPDELTPLMAGVNTDNPKMVQLLVGWKADIDAKTSAGDSAVILSGTQENPEVARILIDEGGDINTKNNAGESALARARRARNLKVITFLESRRAKG